MPRRETPFVPANKKSNGASYTRNNNYDGLGIKDNEAKANRAFRSTPSIAGESNSTPPMESHFSRVLLLKKRGFEFGVASINDP